MDTKNKMFDQSMRATRKAFDTVDLLYPELEDSQVRQKLIETELCIYDPEGEELEDPRFQAALKRRTEYERMIFLETDVDSRPQ
jgi:hypothetical protein